MNIALIDFLNIIEEGYTWNCVLNQLQQNDLYALLFNAELTKDYNKDIQILREIYFEYVNKVKANND